MNKYNSALIIAVSVALIAQQPALSTAEDEFKEGMRDYQARNYRKALTHFEAALAQGKGSADCYLAIANSNYALGNKSEAIRRFTLVTKIFAGLPAEATARKALKQLDPQNKFVDAVPTAEPPEKKDPYFDKGMLLLKQKNFTAARGCFEYCLSKKPNDEDALYYKALCYHYEGNRPRAIETYSYLAKNFRGSAKGTQALKHLESLSPTDYKKLASVASPATVGDSEYISDTGTYRDKRIVLSDDEYKTEFAGIPKRTEIALTHGLAAGENAIPATINGQQFLMRVRRQEWETLLSLQDAKHARLAIPTGKPNSFEKNEFSNSSFPVWRTTCEISVGGIKRKVPVAIADDTIGAPRLGRAFFEDLKMDGTYNTLVLTKISDTVALGKKAQILADKNDYDSLPDTAEIRFFPGDHGHMVVDAHINGKPTRCMFDTGANEFFSLDQLSRCGVTIPANKPPDGSAAGWAGKPIPVWKVTVPIKVGTITRTLEVRAAQEGVTMPLIGQGFIRDYQYSIDRSGGRMTLYKKTSKLAKEQSTEKHSLYDVACTVEGEREFVHLTINGRRVGPVLVDTGAANTIISKNLANSAGVEIPANAMSGTISGVGGELPVRQVFVDLQLGPVGKRDFPILVGGSGMSAIGQDFMSGWRFTVDRDKQLLRFFH